eukprot:jgi/Galph1/207/GphlegSOOS_G4890.1
MSVAETSQVEATLAAHISPITEELVYGRALVRALSLELLLFGFSSFVTRRLLPLLTGLSFTSLQEGEPFETSTVTTTIGIGYLVCFSALLAVAYADCLVLSPEVLRGNWKYRILQRSQSSNYWVHGVCCAFAGFLIIPAFCTAVFSRDGRIVLGTDLFQLGSFGFVFGVLYSLQVQYDKFLVKFPHTLLPSFRRCKTCWRPALETSASLSCGFLLILLLIRLFSIPLQYRSLLISNISNFVSLVLLASLIFFHCFLGLEMFKVFASQRIDFEPPEHLRHIVGVNEWLIQGLITKRQPIVQWLAFLDLNQVAVRFPRRCHALFSDVTGETWKIVYLSCIECIDSLTREVTELLESDSSTKINMGAELPTDIQKLNELRNSGLGAVLRKRVDTNANQKSVPRDAREVNFQSSDKKKKRTFITFPLFGSQRKIRWAIQSIAFIAAESRENDIYGQVQISLSGIISSLLQCHITLSAYLRLSLIRNGVAKENKAAFAVRDTIEIALCKLTETFPEYFQKLLHEPATVASWNSELNSYLQLFLNKTCETT